MGSVSSFVVTDFSGRDLKNTSALMLTIEGLGNFDIVQFSMTYALNEIPRAACMVAVGRNARSVSYKAAIHNVGVNLTQLRKAWVWFQPQDYWNTDSFETWDTTSKAKCIFQGYFTGVAYKKISEKVQPVLHLIHWACDLGFSSTLSANHHPSNPSSLVFPAVTQMAMGAGTAGPPIYVTHHFGHEAIRSKVKSDLWGGIKEMLCEMTEINKFGIYCRSQCSQGEGEKRKNIRAQRAFQKIEGKSSKYGLDPVYSKPLKMDTRGIPMVEEAVADAVTSGTLESFWNTTYWDTIIGLYCPMFSMAFVPLVDRGLVIADCPAYNGDVWRTIHPNEYDDIDLTGMIPRPLQAVGVYADFESLTNWNMSEVAKGDTVCLGGHFSAPAPSPSVDDTDGTWLVVNSPSWLKKINYVGLYSGFTDGSKFHNASPTASTPKKPPPPQNPTPGAIIKSGVCQLYASYAHAVYIENMLRGRGATISGKLRFDIAPGSIVCIETNSEVFLQGEDQLAVPLYAQVARTTININAEARLAGTTFQVTHLRTKTENEDVNQRTCVGSHPLFKNPIFFGCGLNATHTPDQVDREWEFANG